MTDPNGLSARVHGALAEAAPAMIARADQLAALWREFFTSRGLDLTDPVVNAATQRTLTMVYGLASAARATGELDDASWAAVSDIIASGTTATAVLFVEPTAAQQTIPGL